MKKPLPKWTWIAIVGAALAAIAFFWNGGNPDGSTTLQIETSAIDTGDIVRSVATSGAVRPLITVEVGSQLSGQIAEIYADFNTPVEKDQILALIDTQTFETRVLQDTANLRVAESNVIVQRANIDRANANLRRAQLEELLAGTTIEELEQAEQAVAQAEARRDAASIDVERHEIRAPVDGLFDSRLFEPGERPVPGQPVAVMLGGDQVYARIFVPERLRVRVTPGTAAEIHVDGLDGAVTGRVRWVASEAAFTPYFALTERDRGRLTFLAKVDITEQRERLPDGVPVEVDLGSNQGR